jgi:hypothetical protein
LKEDLYEKYFISESNEDLKNLYLAIYIKYATNFETKQQISDNLQNLKSYFDGPLDDGPLDDRPAIKTTFNELFEIIRSLVIDFYYIDNEIDSEIPDNVINQTIDDLESYYNNLNILLRFLEYHQ